VSARRVSRCGAAELDAELLSSAAEYNRLKDQDRETWGILRNEDDDVGQAYWDEAAAEGGIWDRTDGAAKQVIALPAATPEGIHAKASVLKRMLTQFHQEQINEGCAEEEIALSWSLVCDILGRTV
jgi:hypothetical protein